MASVSSPRIYTIGNMWYMNLVQQFVIHYP